MQTASPRRSAAAAADMQTRAIQLLIADATWAVGTALQSVTRSRGQLVPTILIGQAIERRAAAVNAQTMCMSRPIERSVLSVLRVDGPDGRPAGPALAA